MKRERQKNLLFELADLLEKNHIVFWLEFGTLLGAVRDKNFIGNDWKDIDLGLDYKDYWKVKNLLEKNGWKFKHIWLRELAVYKREEELPLHIDLFFVEKDRKNMYRYLYRPDHKRNGEWVKEWRCVSLLEYHFPLKKINFLGRKFNIPNQREKYLELHYGNWKEPKEEYTTYENSPDRDSSYDITNRVTAIVPVFLRKQCLFNLITSIRKFYPKLKIIVGYQGDFGEKIKDDLVEIIFLPFDCGLSYSRNELVKKVDTEYTLLLDDDFVFIEETILEKLLDVFAYEKDIGIVGGRLKDKSYEKFFIFAGEILSSIYFEELREKGFLEYRKINNLNFGFADIIYNFFIAKTKVLKKYKWDNRHLIWSEHLDFFLNLKLNSKVKVAFVPEVIVEHKPLLDSKFKKFRNRMFYDLIYKKFGYKIGHTIGENAVLNYEKNRREKL